MRITMNEGVLLPKMLKSFYAEIVHEVFEAKRGK